MVSSQMQSAPQGGIYVTSEWPDPPVPFNVVLHRVLGGVGRFLIALGVIVLLFVAFQLWGTGLETKGHQTELAKEFVKDLPGPTERPAADAQASSREALKSLANVDPTAAKPMAAPPEGQALGYMEIPKIGLGMWIVEGVSKDDLKKGPGHYAGTPLPGQPGNVAIAGHRTTYLAPFNRIDELTPGDSIYITTTQGKFHYVVLAPKPTVPHIEEGPGWFSVLPTETEVLAPTSDNRLTMTACHPKHSAKQRIIVQSRLVSDVAAAPVITPAVARVQRTEIRKDANSLGGDAAAKWPALIFGFGLVVSWFLAWLIGTRWRKWTTYLLFSPLFALMLWCCFLFTDRWLPSF